MTLEPVAASTAGQHERGQHGQCRKNPLHLSLPSLGSTTGKSGGLVGDLRCYRGPIRIRNTNTCP